MEIKNGDRVKYRSGITFIFVGLNPLNNKQGYCIHPTAIDKNCNMGYKRLDLLPMEDLAIVK